MPDYAFYKDAYLGSSIPESAFAGLIARAQAWLDMLARRCRVEPYGPDSRKMALCAIAETLLRQQKRQDCQQLQLGSVRVHYESSRQSLQRQLLQSAAGYLDICRGVR